MEESEAGRLRELLRWWGRLREAGSAGSGRARKVSTACAFLLLTLLGAMGGCGLLSLEPAACDPGPRDVVCVGEIALAVEVADTPEERRRGLSGRDSLPWNRGMLFVFPESGRHSFTMENTGLSLTVAFLDAQGVIVDLRPLEPYDPTPVRPVAPARYAIEVNRGWVTAQRAGVGDTVRLGETVD